MAPFTLSPFTTEFKPLPVSTPAGFLPKGFSCPFCPCAATVRAGIIDDSTFAVTLAAGSADTEKPLLKPDLAGAAAGRADLRFGARLCAAAATGVATFVIGDIDLCFNAKSRLFETDFHIVLQIVAALAPSPLRRRRQDIAEDIAENIAERGSGAKAEARGESACAHTGMAELIVLGSFLRIREDFIGLGDFLELLFGLLIPGILVRMIADRQLPESLLDLRFRCIPMNSEHLVIIAFFTVCQNRPFGKRQRAKGKRGVISAPLSH